MGEPKTDRRQCEMKQKPERRRRIQTETDVDRWRQTEADRGTERETRRGVAKHRTPNRYPEIRQGRPNARHAK